MVQDNIGVTGVTSGEYNHLEVYGKSSQHLYCVRADVYPCLDHLPCWKLDWESDIVGYIHTLIAVDQGLIEVEHHCLLP